MSAGGGTKSGFVILALTGAVVAALYPVVYLPFAKAQRGADLGPPPQPGFTKGSASRSLEAAKRP
jgi:hypothetical protein